MLPSEQRSGVWKGDQYTAPDGRVYEISSSKARNEDRWYFGIEGAVALDLSTGSFHKQTVRRQIERYAQERCS